MRQKTFTLPDDCSLEAGVVVHPDYPAAAGYRVGARGVLVSERDESPAARGSGRWRDECFELRFDCPDGVPGLFDNLHLFHGFRGRVNDVRTIAYGEREIIAIRALKNGRVRVTVGPDLRPNED